jgi:hypothetical protein
MVLITFVPSVNEASTTQVPFELGVIEAELPDERRGAVVEETSAPAGEIQVNWTYFARGSLVTAVALTGSPTPKSRALVLRE